MRGVSLNPPRVGEILAGAFGALLLVSLFLPWYRGTVICVTGPCPQPEATAFEAFTVLDVVLAMVAVAGVGLLVLELTQPTPAVPVAWAAMVTPLGLVASALVLWRVLAPPSSTASQPVFALLGLVACVGLTAGSYLSMRNDRPSARRLGQGTGRAAPEPISIPDRPDAGRGRA